MGAAERGIFTLGDGGGGSGECRSRGLVRLFIVGRRSAAGFRVRVGFLVFLDTFG